MSETSWDFSYAKYTLEFSLYPSFLQNLSWAPVMNLFMHIKLTTREAPPSEPIPLFDHEHLLTIWMYNNTSNSDSMGAEVRNQAWSIGEPLHKFEVFARVVELEPKIMKIFD